MNEQSNILLGLQLTGKAMGHQVQDYIRIALEAAKEPLKALSAGERLVAGKLAEQPWFPMVGEQFYYAEGQDVEPIFREALKNIGEPDAGVKAETLAKLSPEAAYKAFKEISPSVAKELRSEIFRKSGAGGKIIDIYEQAADEAMSGLYKLVTDPISSLVGKGPSPARDEYKKATRERHIDINLDAKRTGYEDAFFSNFIGATPIVRDFVSFGGSGAVKLQSELSYRAIGGIGALTSLIMQLMLMQKILGPKMRPVARRMDMWASNQFATAKRITPLMKAGRSIVTSVGAGMEFGTSYASMAAMQISLDNIASGKTFDNEDMVRIIRSAELGSMIGGIAKYWALQHNLPPVMAKAGEETEQCIVAALQGVRGIYESRGDVSPQDFWQAMAWEMTEVPFENMLPIFLGMGNLGSILGYRGQPEAMARAAVDAKVRILRPHMPTFSDAKIEDLARGDFNESIEKAEKKLAKQGKELDLMGVKKVFDSYDKQAMKETMPDYVVASKRHENTWKNIAERPHLRRMYLEFIARYGEPNENNLTEQNIMDLFNDPQAKSFNLEEMESVQDVPFLVRQILTEVATMHNFGIKTADVETKATLRNLISERFIDVDTEEAAELSGREYIKLISNWSEAQLGNKLGIDELFDYEVKAMIDEVENLNSFAPEAATSRLKTYLDGSKTIDEYVENMFDAIRGIPILASRSDLWGEYAAVRKGYISQINVKADMQGDFRNIVKNKLGFRLSLDKPFRIVSHALRHGLSADELIQNFKKKGYNVSGREAAIKDMIEELSAYITSDLDSSYLKRDAEGNFINNTWDVSEGLRLHMGIKEALTLKDYYPLIMHIAAQGDFRLMERELRNPHNTIAKLAKKEFTLDEWMANPESGWTGLNLYLNRGLRNRYLRTPLRRFVKAEAKKGLPSSTDLVWKRWVISMRGEPIPADKQVNNLIKSLTSKIGLKLDDQAAMRFTNTVFSFIYAGGLGLKMSAAMKNALQGPMNVPPGMTLYWWVRGLHRTWTDPAARQEAWDAGILRSLAVPVLSQEFETTLGNALRHTLFMFTWVDHYMNRVPTYIAARMQFQNFISRFQDVDGEGLTGVVRRIGNYQEPGIASRWMKLAQEGEGAYTRWKETGEARHKEAYDDIVRTISDEYGFIQQANSNWEYGKLGRPSIWGSTKGKFFGQYLTWPTWYMGTYLPSLVRQDPMNLMRHIAKGYLLMWMFAKFFGMNIKPWILQGAFPMRPYGPTPQVAFNALELLKAWEYGHKGWATEKLDDLKRSLLIGIPGYYGISDFVKLLRDMTKEMPYTEDRTGVFHYGMKPKKALADFLGVTNYYNVREQMLELTRQGEYEAARDIGKAWGIEPLRTTDGSYRIKKIGGI